MDQITEILNLLVRQKKIKPEQVIEIKKRAAQTGESVESIVVKDEIVSEEDYARAKAEIYGFPYVNLTEKKIDSDILQIIPNEVADNYKLVCFDKEDKKIKVGLLNPNNFKAIEAVDFLAKRSGFQVEYYVISHASLTAALKGYSSLKEEVSSAIESHQQEEVLEELPEEENIEEVTKSAPIAKIVSVIIRHAVEGGASDIHIEPLFNETRVRYRIDGILHTSLVLPRNIHSAVVARVKILANLRIDETRLPQDGRIRMKIEDRKVDFRVSTLPLVGAEKVVMRILEADKKPPSLDKLGFQGRSLKVVKDSMKKTEGMFLVTGPTGSGKSTTLFSILYRLNKEGINISTLEDPVEYNIEGINQSQIKPEIGFTFAAGLRSFLRQDPDIIMVGEIRDEETAELAVHAALTGHYVLSTLHTISAIGVIPRLVDMGVEPFLLGSTLKVVVAQRLTRCICEHCKTEVELPDKMVDFIKHELNKMPPGYVKDIIKDFNPDGPWQFSVGKGCSRCGNSGFKGRTAIVEVLEINSQIQEAIANGKKNFTLKEVQETQPFITFLQDGIIKVLQGITTLQEVLRVAQD